jgi:hypothetical protein
MVALLTMVSLEVQPLRSSFGKVFMGAAGGEDLPSDDQFNRVSFLSHFDGSNDGVNNAFDDGSDSNHTVTAYGNVTQGSFGPFAKPDGEWGVRFPQGHWHYCDIPSSSDFAIGANDDFTFEFFIFYDSKDSDMLIMDYRTGGSNGTFPGIFLNGNLDFNGNDNSANAGKISYNPHPSTIDSVLSASTLTFGAWNHVAFVRNSGTINYYINGTRDNNSYTNNTTVATAANIRLGSIAVNQDFPDLQFSGILSNFRFVNGTAVYSGSSITVPTSKLTAITNTKLLVFQSNRFVDNSASGHTVPVSDGSPAVTAFGPFLSSSVYDPAVNGASAYFDGTADALSIAASPISASGNFTLEGWVYSNSASEQAIVGQYQGRSTGRMIITTSNGKLIFFQNGVTGGNSGSNVTVGQWAHFVLQRTGSNIAFYENGARVLNNSAGNIAQDYLVIGAEDVNSGNYPNNFDGYISNIRITSSAVYSEGTSITVPTAPYSTVTDTNFLLNMADGQAIDSAAQNNLTFNGTSSARPNISTSVKKFGDSSFYVPDTTFAISTDGPSFGTGDFTVEMWIYWAGSPGAASTIYSQITSDSDAGLEGPHLYWDNSTQKIIYFANNGNRITSTNAVSNTTWYHLALCRASGSTKMFLDGTQTGSTYSDTINFTGAANIQIGTYRLNGTNVARNNQYYDDLRVSSFARYTSNFTAPTAAFADKGQ